MRVVKLYEGKFVLKENGELWKINKTRPARLVEYTTDINGEVLFRSVYGTHKVMDLLAEHFVDKEPGCNTLVLKDKYGGLCASNLEWVDRSIGVTFIEDGIQAKVISHDKAVREDGMITYLNKNRVYPGSAASSGYMKTYLGTEQVLVHRLVAKAFLPEGETNESVDHINENKHDNRVVNLRWCTGKENTAYYTDMRENRLLKQLEEKNTELSRLHMVIKAGNKEMHRLGVDLAKAQDRLTNEQKRFDDYVAKENARIVVAKENYQGYADTTGMKFESRQAMLEATGKQITVHGQLFPSCGAAAKWIVNQEAAANRVRNKDTISKELRRFLQGRKNAWIMYDKYSIGS